MSRWLAIVLLVIMTSPASAQWQLQYATYDDPSINGTGNRTPGVGVIHENMFVALVARYSSGVNTTNYMIPYVNADSVLGRRYTYGYGSAAVGVFEIWSDGAFDQDSVKGAFSITATPDSFIYVPSNDALHNLFVFKYEADTVTVVPVDGNYPREETGAQGLSAVAIDKNGYVYVCADTTMLGGTEDVMIYPPVSHWALSHQTSKARTIDLPDGIYKGITVSPDGGWVFVSDYMHRRVLKYSGSVASGYTLDPSFNFTLGDNDTANLLHVGPMGMGYLMPNNILAVACAPLVLAPLFDAYTYSRVYFLNPNNGALISPDSTISVLDQAKWNLDMTGAYDNNMGGSASGYGSLYSLGFDENGNLYCNSYYAWTIEKWRFNGTLPTFTSVQRIGGTIPDGYTLSQNYPNPFNPTTTIDFTIPRESVVRISVVNMLGEEVALLVNSSRPAGQYRVIFDGGALPSGTYFCIMKAGSFTETRKLILLK